MAWHRKMFFLSIYGFLSISHIKGCRNHITSKDVEKLRNCRDNLWVHSRLHTDTQVLTSHVGKIVEWWCFGCDSIAISEIAFWMFVIVAHCNIIRAYQGDKKERKLCRKKKNGHRKILREWHHFSGCTPTPCVIFHHFFRELPSHFLSEVLFE